jgi:RNAse (barnase) inhibitor barstar
MSLLPVGVAPLVLERSQACGLRVLGAEGFELCEDGSLRPRLDRLADYSHGEPDSTALDEWMLDPDLLVEFVFDCDPEVVFVIDGALFEDLEGFYSVASKALMNTDWEISNLDGFNDILRGGFGKTPDGGYTLVLRNAARSSRMLGHRETASWLRTAAERCHPTNREAMLNRLERAESGEGETLFEMIVQIIFMHCPGGAEAEDNVHFVMEA